MDDLRAGRCQPGGFHGDIVAIEDRLETRLLKAREEDAGGLRRLLEWGRGTGGSRGPPEGMQPGKLVG